MCVVNGERTGQNGSKSKKYERSEIWLKKKSDTNKIKTNVVITLTQETKKEAKQFECTNCNHLQGTNPRFAQPEKTLQLHQMISKHMFGFAFIRQVRNEDDVVINDVQMISKTYFRARCLTKNSELKTRFNSDQSKRVNRNKRLKLKVTISVDKRVAHLHTNPIPRHISPLLTIALAWSTAVDPRLKH